jgi:hypothetical protein
MCVEISQFYKIIKQKTKLVLAKYLVHLIASTSTQFRKNKNKKNYLFFQKILIVELSYF